MAVRLHFLVAAGFACGIGAVAQPNYNLPLDRPYTLRLPQGFAMERELARQIRSDRPMSFIFPRPCFSEVDSSRVCGEAGGWGFVDSARLRSLSLSPELGYEYRYLNENVHAFEGGVLAVGGSGPVSFYLDARMFTEFHEIFNAPSYDREIVEKQDPGASGSVAYSSYSRYRANLSYDFNWGRFSAGRDAAHWGPGLYNNLVFSQETVPFNQATFTTWLGPVTLHSLYGQMVVEGDHTFDTTHESRSVYAHRYEWNAARNLIFGISEQLIVYNSEEPFAFLPVVPLFAFKSDAYERLNNGNIAGDFCFRLPGLGAVYSEFLIDDIQSPTSLFDDQWGNKWGWMAGARWVHAWRTWNFSAVLEYARIEPWVYTHYLPASAQAANQGYPLGNPMGPNGQRVNLGGFAGRLGWQAMVESELLWKGKDPGSQAMDLPPPGIEKKTFLYGVSRPRWRIRPGLAYAGRRFSILGYADAPEGAVVLNARAWY